MILFLDYSCLTLDIANKAIKHMLETLVLFFNDFTVGLGRLFSVYVPFTIIVNTSIG
jgi:hypothetical protein